MQNFWKLNKWPLKASVSGLHAIGELKLGPGLRENPAHMKYSINGSYVTLVTYFITQFIIRVGEKSRIIKTSKSNFSEFRVTLFN